MRLEEVAPGALAESDLRAAAGDGRLQYDARWLAFAAEALPRIAGEGARLSVLVALDGEGPLGALPLLRTTPRRRPRPFPFDLEDFFFGLWIRAAADGDRELRARALAARGLAAVLGAINPSLGRALVVHGPLAPVTDALAAPRLSPEQAPSVLAELTARARQIAADEGRCAFVPRLPRAADAWREAFAGWTRVPCYPVAALSPLAPLSRSARQMIARNRRLVERHGVTVEVGHAAPPGVPFGALFAATAARHRDPAPLLDDGFFDALGARFAPRVRFVSARAGGRAAGFLAVLEHGASWEAFKCGTDRAAAAQAPVYLDLVYGRLRELAAEAGVARVELGAGELDLKRRYGARVEGVDAYVALPPGFRGGGAFTAYLGAVGEGIARREEAGPALRALES